jgi:hypothetical protein
MKPANFFFSSAVPASSLAFAAASCFSVVCSQRAMLFLKQ